MAVELARASAMQCPLCGGGIYLVRDTDIEDFLRCVKKGCEAHIAYDGLSQGDFWANMSGVPATYMDALRAVIAADHEARQPPVILVQLHDRTGRPMREYQFTSLESALSFVQKRKGGDDDMNVHLPWSTTQKERDEVSAAGGIPN